MAQRTDATNFLGSVDSLAELDRLKFAVYSLIERYPLGSCDRENAENAARGIKHRIDYLYDSLSLILPIGR